MTQKTTAQQLRSFLMGVAAFIFIGNVAELYLLDHFEQAQQWIPIILSAVGFMVTVTAWQYPGPKVLATLRWLMVITALASIYGMYLHFSSNYSFTQEINPSFSAMEAVWPAIKGSNPLLAPGILFLAAVLAIAGTYKHPALDNVK
ncbi:hypothetical protein [Fodinibius salsisoli]|uniref:Uncharacterized protein n=1 Tax=Fodinibius salsisoli TaxID=2820877 RepID=A0ABT3PKH7_9BACT|nr:hypothetical protein [Fodinibius salsisoli]MCW9706445.1 hypothetical protein [Fodinibius salsisoli]